MARASACLLIALSLGGDAFVLKLVRRTPEFSRGNPTTATSLPPKSRQKKMSFVDTCNAVVDSREDCSAKVVAIAAAAAVASETLAEPKTKLSAAKKVLAIATVGARGVASAQAPRKRRAVAGDSSRRVRGKAGSGQALVDISKNGDAAPRGDNLWVQKDDLPAASTAARQASNQHLSNYVQETTSSMNGIFKGYEEVTLGNPNFVQFVHLLVELKFYHGTFFNPNPPQMGLEDICATMPDNIYEKTSLMSHYLEVGEGAPPTTNSGTKSTLRSSACLCTLSMQSKTRPSEI